MVSVVEQKVKDTLRLVNLADLHFGHVNCDKKILTNVISYINSNKNVMWLGGGDYCDAITHSDPRFNKESIDSEYDTPQKQYKKVKKMLEPIANKCLGLLHGNHDYIHFKKSEHNYVSGLAEDLDIPYLGVDSYMRFHFQKYKTPFNLFTHHGWTGARTAGGRINRIYDLFLIFPMCDLYIMNHIHALSLAEPKTVLFIGKEGEIHEKISRFAYGGSFLRGYVKNKISYVEEKTYQPTTLGSPLFVITPKKGKHTTTYNLVYSEIR